MPAEVLLLDAFRLDLRRSSHAERLPLAASVDGASVTLILGNERELRLTADQALELAADLKRLARDARGRS